MTATVKLAAPAATWTVIDPGGSLGMRISNRSFSVSIRVAVKATEPSASDGFFVLAPDAAGAMAPESLAFAAGDKVWVRPHDHSGLAGTVAYQLDAVEA